MVQGVGGYTARLRDRVPEETFSLTVDVSDSTTPIDHDDSVWIPRLGLELKCADAALYAA